MGVAGVWPVCPQSQFEKVGTYAIEWSVNSNKFKQKFSWEVGRYGKDVFQLMHLCTACNAAT